MKSVVWRCGRAWLLVIGLVFAGAAMAQSPEQSAAKLPLWEASGPEGSVYLFGSIHVCRADCYPLSPVVLKRYAASNSLVVELDAKAAGVSEAVAKKMRLSSDENLEALMTVSDFQRLRRVVSSFGLPWSEMQKLKPWTLEVMLGTVAMQAHGLSIEDGVDALFLDMAKAQHKAVRELETVQSQIDLLASKLMAQQIQALNISLALIESGQYPILLEHLLHAWQTGDAARMDHLIDELSTDGGQFRAEFLDRRNIGMSDKIAAMLAAGDKPFVVVGMAHLVGAASIQNLLAKRGYTIRQLTTAD